MGIVGPNGKPVINFKEGQTGVKGMTNQNELVKFPGTVNVENSIENHELHMLIPDGKGNAGYLSAGICKIYVEDIVEQDGKGFKVLDDPELLARANKLFHKEEVKKPMSTKEMATKMEAMVIKMAEMEKQQDAAKGTQGDGQGKGMDETQIKQFETGFDAAEKAIASGNFEFAKETIKHLGDIHVGIIQENVVRILNRDLIGAMDAEKDKGLASANAGSVVETRQQAEKKQQDEFDKTAIEATELTNMGKHDLAQNMINHCIEISVGDKQNETCTLLNQRNIELFERNKIEDEKDIMFNQIVKRDLDNILAEFKEKEYKIPTRGRASSVKYKEKLARIIIQKEFNK